MPWAVRSNAMAKFVIAKMRWAAPKTQPRLHRHPCPLDRSQKKEPPLRPPSAASVGVERTRSAPQELDQRWNDLLMGVFSKEVAGVVDLHHLGSLEGVALQLIQHPRPEGRTLHRPHDLDRLPAPQPGERCRPGARGMTPGASPQGPNRNPAQLVETRELGGAKTFRGVGNISSKRAPRVVVSAVCETFSIAVVEDRAADRR